MKPLAQLRSSVAKLIAQPIATYPRDTVACFDPTCGELPRRSLDATRLRAFLQCLDHAKVGGLLIGASTGHGHLRTVEELQSWFKQAANCDLEHATLMALLRPEDGEAFNRSVAIELEQGGYDVAFVRPGTHLDVSANAMDIAENMMPTIAAVADAGLAVGLYSIPDVSGVAMPVESVVQVLDSPYGERIVAIKVTEASFEQSTKRFLEAPELSSLMIVQGWDPHIAKAFQMGGDRIGVTSGPMSFALHQYQHMLAAANRSDWDELSRAQSAVTALFESMQDDPTKFADLQRAKTIMGLGHPVSGTTSGDSIERVFDALRSIERSHDRRRLAQSLNLLGDGPYAESLQAIND